MEGVGEVGCRKGSLSISIRLYFLPTIGSMSSSRAQGVDDAIKSILYIVRVKET